MVVVAYVPGCGSDDDGSKSSGGAGGTGSGGEMTGGGTGGEVTGSGGKVSSGGSSGGMTGTAGTSSAGATAAGGAGNEGCAARVAICGRGVDGVECALSDGTEFGAVTLWDATYSDDAGWNLAIGSWGTIYYPDLDGDGRGDVCGRGPDGMECALSTGSGFADNSQWTTGFSDAAGWGTYSYHWSTIRFPDLNGDGMADICGRTSSGMVCELSTGSAFSSSSTWTSEYAADWEGSAAYWATIEFPDLNGDGKADVCGRASNGLYCGVSSGSAFSDPIQWTAGFSDADGWASLASNYATIQYPDVNGDTKADVCGRTADGVQCALSDGTQFLSLDYWDGVFKSPEWTAQENWGTIQFPDLNGDGMADLCGRDSTGVICALSTGEAFEVAAPWTTAFNDGTGWSGSDSWGTIQFPDINADGMSDICGRSEFGIWCAISNGIDGFSDLEHWQTAFNNADGWLAPEYWGPIGFPIEVPADCDPPALATPLLRPIQRFML